jgi:hypothetical protein
MTIQIGDIYLDNDARIRGGHLRQRRLKVVELDVVHREKHYVKCSVETRESAEHPWENTGRTTRILPDRLREPFYLHGS